MLKQFWNDEQGATMAEYALLIALVAGVLFLVIQTFGDNLRTLFDNIGTRVGEAADNMD